MQQSDFLALLGYGGFICCLLLIAGGVLYQLRRKQSTPLPPPTSYVGGILPPHRQPGVPAPYVYNASTPWGWLVYRNGNFFGQELALKRAIISVGRDADNEVELDDDTISRYHAELAWDHGQVYITDYGSLNGVLLNGQRVHASMLVRDGDVLDIGVHRFIMKFAPPPLLLDDANDPLLKYVRHPNASKNAVDTTIPLSPSQEKLFVPPKVAQPYWTNVQAPSYPLDITLLDTSLLNDREGQPAREQGLCLLRNGEHIEGSFLLDRPQLTVGRAPECDIVINHPSLSLYHLRFFHQPTGDYVQNMASYYQSHVNGSPLQTLRLLHIGDIIALGSLHLEYQCVPHTPVRRQPLSLGGAAPLNLPGALRLPSRLVEQPRLPRG